MNIEYGKAMLENFYRSDRKINNAEKEICIGVIFGIVQV